MNPLSSPDESDSGLEFSFEVPTTPTAATPEAARARASISKHTQTPLSLGPEVAVSITLHSPGISGSTPIAPHTSDVWNLSSPMTATKPPPGPSHTPVRNIGPLNIYSPSLSPIGPAAPGSQLKEQQQEIQSPLTPPTLPLNRALDTQYDLPATPQHDTSQYTMPSLYSMSLLDVPKSYVKASPSTPMQHSLSHNTFQSTHTSRYYTPPTSHTSKYWRSRLQRRDLTSVLESPIMHRSSWSR